MTLSTSPAVRRAERAVVAGTARNALRIMSGLVGRGPVRETADEVTDEDARVAVVLHLGVVLAILGAATFVVRLFFVVPATLFVSVFAAATVVFGTLGIRALRRRRLAAGRGWLFWAGIAWGLVVASGAYLAGLTGFVPHLWLAWTLGMLVLGVVGAGAVQTAVAGVLAALWVGAAALVGESLLPGLVILAVLLAFPVLARPSRLVGAAATILTLALTVAFTAELLPGTPALPLAVTTAVATCGILCTLGVGGPLVTALGVVALVVLPVPPVLDALRGQVSDSGAAGARAGLLFGVGALVAAAALPANLRRGPWPAILAWLAGSAALVAALTLAVPVPAILTAAAGALVAGYGLSRPIDRTRQALLSLAWLALAALLLGAGRPWFVIAALLVALGAYAMLLARRLRRTAPLGAAVPYGTGGPLGEGQPP